MRGPEEWRWPAYFLPGMSQRIWFPALTLLLTIGLTYMFRQRWSERQSMFVPVFFFAAAVLIQLGFLYLEHAQILITLFQRTVSASSGGFFNVAATINDSTSLNDLLRHFPERMAQFKAIHPRTHPPGLLLLFWGATQLLAQWPVFTELFSQLVRPAICQDIGLAPLNNAVLASALVQMSVPLWGALTVFPFYGLARRLFNRQVAYWATLLLILTPSMVLWATRWNQLYTFIAAATVYLVYRGLTENKWHWLFVAGIMGSFATFFSLTNLALVAIVPVYVILFHLLFTTEKARQLRPLIRHLLWFIAGLSTLWLIYALVYGVTFGQIVRGGLAVHGELNRSYALWVGYNLYDFFLFLGWPVAVALLIGLGRMVHLVIRPAEQGGKTVLPSGIVYWPVMAFWLILLPLDLSGIVRGEVARLWMFLVPLALWAALPVLASWSPRWIWGMIGFQAAALILLGVNLRPVETGFAYFAPRLVDTTVPTITHPVAAAFGADQTIEFHGYSLTPETLHPGETLEITLYWQMHGETYSAYPYTIFVHLVDMAGVPQAQHDGQPQEGALPCSCWQKEEMIADTHRLVLPDTLAPGTYSLRVGLYRLDLLLAGDPNHRLPVVGAGQPGDYVQLGVVEVK